MSLVCIGPRARPWGTRWRTGASDGDEGRNSDLIVFPVSRETIFIELKAGKGSLGELQVEWRDWLLNAGYDWHLIRDVSTFSRILESRLGRLNGVV